MNDPRMEIEFFHDVVCGWCFVMSPRLRQIAREFPIRIIHRSFVLQDSRSEMVRVFGSMERAKSIILDHWESCALHDDEKRINVERMRRRTFEYPSGWLGALACQAAEIQRGSEGHWDMFDAIQKAHLTDNLDIADRMVLLGLASDLEFEIDRFDADMSSEYVGLRVAKDRQRARDFGIRSIPTIVVWPSGTRFQTTRLNELRQRLGHLLALDAGSVQDLGLRGSGA